MMPLRMRRKARGMEKVENLYCTARAQHVMPRRSIKSPGAEALADSSLRDKGAASPQSMGVGSRAWGPALQRTAARCAASWEWRPVVDQETFVSRMRRGTVSAFTRVFDTLW